MKKRIFTSTEFYVGIVLVLLCLLIQMKSGQFFTGNNAVDLLRAFSVPAMFCIGEMFVIITGGVDVSFPAIASMRRCSSVLPLGLSTALSLRVSASLHSS